jgi:hypothetical protein
MLTKPAHRLLSASSARSLQIMLLILLYTLKISDRSNEGPSMPRASRSGFLRLSLVSCPVYLSPATTHTKSVRLHQVWRLAAADEPRGAGSTARRAACLWVNRGQAAGPPDQTPRGHRPPPVIDLMAALKRSLSRETPAISGTTAKKKPARRAADRRQRPLLLPVAGSRKRKEEPATEPAAVAMKPRKKASRLAVKQFCGSGSMWLR